MTNIREEFPFLTCIKYNEEEYFGIMINSDDKLITFYDVGAVRTTDKKKELLQLGEEWWWESNRQIPPNIFIGDRMEEFRYCIKSFNYKECTIVYGPIVSLASLITKRIKRRQIQLVKKIN